MIKNLVELEKLIRSHDSIVLYGAGIVGHSMLLYIQQKEYLDKILGVVDSNKDGELLGFPVLRLTELAPEKYKDAIFLITAGAAKQEIKATLELAGYTKVFLLGNLLCKVLNGFSNREKYQNAREIKFLRENRWKDQGKYKSSEYEKLIHGLDDKSIDTVDRILQRVKLVLSKKDQEFDFYTEDEKRELYRVSEQFYGMLIDDQQYESVYAYLHYLLPIPHFDCSVLFYKHGFDQIYHPERLCGQVFVDAGGFIGDSILVMEDLKPGKIISFEAVSDHCGLIHKTLELNHISNVTVENLALGEKEGTIEIQVSGSSSNGMSRKGITYAETVSTPLIRLDDYVEEHGISNLGLIKADIEGMEPYFLRGARQTIERFRPILLISIYHDPNDFFGIKPMIESWDLGYRFSIYKPVGNGTVVTETLLIAQVMDI